MNQSKTNSSQFILIILLILVSAITRLIPHPFNVTAIGAMVLFSGANIRDRRIAFLLPIVAMFFTDIIIGFHFSIIPVYACFAFTVWLGVLISSRQNIINIIIGSIVSSLVFF